MSGLQEIIDRGAIKAFVAVEEGKVAVEIEESGEDETTLLVE